MRPAARVTAAVLGGYAGLLGVAHGVFQVRQGGARIPGLLLSAIGPPCEPDLVWHACLPAMSVLPTFAAAGVASIVLGGLLAVLAVGRLGSAGGSLLVASIVLLLAGGGFVAPITGAAAAACRHGAGRPGRRRPARLGRWWPWLLVGYLAWISIQAITGVVANDLLVGLAGPALLVELALLALVVTSAAAHDADRSR